MKNTTLRLRTAMCAWFAGLLLGSSAAGYAMTISIAITGTVRFVDDFGNFLNGAVQAGDTITGRYTYESTTPDSSPIVGVGDYWHNSPPYGISLMVNGIAFYTDPNNTDFLIEALNNYLTPASDNYLLISYKNIFGISVPDGSVSAPDNLIFWQLDDPTATALSSEALPTVPPVLSDWQSFGLDIFSLNDVGDFLLIRSDVTSAVLILDSDGDGVPDSSDLCPGTLQGAVVDAEGCSIDQLVPCNGPASGGTWKNHGQYVSTVQRIASEFLDNGLLTSEDRNSILKEAAKSSCGKKH